jgi:uncharacterized protein GlcG (DUF336 family)
MSQTVSLESISLDAAIKVAQLTLEHGKISNMAPLAVAVLDVRGILKAYLAADGSSLLRFEIAHAKAWSVLGMGLGARELERRASKVPLFFNNLQVLSEGKMPTVQGGLLIRNSAGQVIGSVGVSGDTSSNDELCGLAAIKQVGLIADHGDQQ